MDELNEMILTILQRNNDRMSRRGLTRVAPLKGMDLTVIDRGINALLTAGKIREETDQGILFYVKVPPPVPRPSLAAMVSAEQPAPAVAANKLEIDSPDGNGPLYGFIDELPPVKESEEEE